ncbi:hypothetical protein AB4Z10_17190 [Bosea sp. RAF48]|uniref:hypothetical protein n=1 Tax=Bosea sp. RAF48 TaxID=3237480 RepID=UPI003F8E23B6
MTTKPLKLELRDITHLAVTVEPGGAAVIVGRGFDDREIEILLAPEALTKLEAFLGQANLEQAKLRSKH